MLLLPREYLSRRGWDELNDDGHNPAGVHASTALDDDRKKGGDGELNDTLDGVLEALAATLSGMSATVRVLGK